MEYEILSHLLLSGEMSVKEIAELLSISETYASKITDRLKKENLVFKERVGKKVIVKINPLSPLIEKFSRFVVIVGNYPPFTPKDFLTPESKRRIVKLLISAPKNISEIKKESNYSRMTINKILKALTKLKILKVKKEKKKLKKYYLIDNPLTRELTGILQYMESDIRLKDTLNRISSDARTSAVVVYGSEIWGRKDKLSDVDALIVVNSPKDLESIKREYEQEGLELNIFSRKGLVHLIKREPWFFKLIIEGRILKGEDFLKGLSEIPSRGNINEVTKEIKEMLRGLHKISLPSDKAKVLEYCIRTLLILKLHIKNELNWRTYYERLDAEYPSFKNLRKAHHKLKTINEKDISILKEKLLREIKDVEKEEEKISYKP